jgi:hypothetical protein
VTAPKGVTGSYCDASSESSAFESLELNQSKVLVCFPRVVAACMATSLCVPTRRQPVRVAVRTIAVFVGAQRLLSGFDQRPMGARASFSPAPNPARYRFLCERRGSATAAMGNSDYAANDTWKGSMMANAARDPLFHAALTVANQDFARIRRYLHSMPFSACLALRALGAGSHRAPRGRRFRERRVRFLPPALHGAKRRAVYRQCALLRGRRLHAMRPPPAPVGASQVAIFDIFEDSRLCVSDVATGLGSNRLRLRAMTMGCARSRRSAPFSISSGGSAASVARIQRAAKRVMAREPDGASTTSATEHHALVAFGAEIGSPPSESYWKGAIFFVRLSFSARPCSRHSVPPTRDRRALDRAEQRGAEGLAY